MSFLLDTDLTMATHNTKDYAKIPGLTLEELAGLIKPADQKP
jgi:predicted nucleic acid-binding protein